MVCTIAVSVLTVTVWSSWLKALTGARYGLLLPSEERPLLSVLYCFSCWPQFDVTRKGVTNVHKDSLFTLAVPDSAVLQTQPFK